MASSAQGDDGIDPSRHPAAGGAPTRRRAAPRAGRLLPAERAERLAQRHRALADPVRLQLLHLVATAADGEVRAGLLAQRVERSDATVSHHLAALVDAGLLRRRRRGRLVLYRPTAAGRAAVTGGR